MRKTAQIGKAKKCPYGCCGWHEKKKVSRYLRRIAKQKNWG